MRARLTIDAGAIVPTLGDALAARALMATFVLVGRER